MIVSNVLVVLGIIAVVIVWIGVSALACHLWRLRRK
jgi:hypothetical protein